MASKAALKGKIEAELGLAKAKLASTKARAKVAASDARIDLEKRTREMERGLKTAKAKLKRAGRAGENRLEQLKDDAQGAWNSLSAAVKKSVRKVTKKAVAVEKAVERKIAAATKPAKKAVAKKTAKKTTARR